MGSGMMSIDCPTCKGRGTIDWKEPPSFHKIRLDKRSTTYKKSVNEIMALDKSLSYKEASKLFDYEFEKD